MGAGASLDSAAAKDASSLPDTLDKATAKAFAGDQFDDAAFDAIAKDGRITREDFDKAAELAKKKASLNEALSKAAKKFDVESCRELIGQGADAKHISYTGADKLWGYSGDGSTCLFGAVSAFHTQARIARDMKGTADSLKKQQKRAPEARYVETVELLLGAGADADFEASGGRGRPRIPLMNVATKTIKEMTDAELKKRLLLSFVKAGVELNVCTTHGKQGHSGGFGRQEYSLFTLVRELETGSDLSLLAVYLSAGVNINCSESSWTEEWDDGDDEEGYDKRSSSRSHRTLLHAAIQTANADLVRLLVAHGADVNQNMVFTSGDRERYYLMSCLQLAMEMGSADVIEVLRTAGALEQVDAELADTVRMFSRNYDQSKAIKYHEGGEGKFRESQEQKKGKKKGGKKKK